MEPSLEIRKIWEDDDMIEVVFAVADGQSVFGTKLYVGHGTLKETVEELDKFKSQVHGGIYDLEWGGFGPEFANGAVRIRLHFYRNARLCISGLIESEYTEFGLKKIASRGELYFYSEPASLDNFIDEMRSLSNGVTDSVSLAGKT
ncbi:MAG: hypothetical protein KDN22_31465 [Verrucomicrobiae bacterium]|nr:hypothetical protein [Verrucomicrobiae bacterium]